MKITFWGAAQTVTGSMHAIQTANETHLLECGLLQGHRRPGRSISTAICPSLPTRSSPLSCRMRTLTTAEIYHTGAKRVDHGRIHATPATAELCQYMFEIQLISRKKTRHSSRSATPAESRWESPTQMRPSRRFTRWPMPIMRWDTLRVPSPREENNWRWARDGAQKCRAHSGLGVCPSRICRETSARLRFCSPAILGARAFRILRDPEPAP